MEKVLTLWNTSPLKKKLAEAAVKERTDRFEKKKGQKGGLQWEGYNSEDKIKRCENLIKGSELTKRVVSL